MNGIGSRLSVLFGLQAAPQAEPWPSILQLEQEGVSQLLQSEAAGQLQQQYTYLYASAPDLRMDDVPVLLRQYKELILKHEALVSAIEAHRANQQSGARPSHSQPAAATGQEEAGAHSCSIIGAFCNSMLADLDVCMLDVCMQTDA